MSEQEYQVCPICTEKIKLGASKCKHCHAMLSVDINENEDSKDVTGKQADKPTSIKEINITENEPEKSKERRARVFKKRHACVFYENEVEKIIGSRLEEPFPFTGPPIFGAVLCIILSIIAFMDGANFLGLVFIIVAVVTLYYSNELTQQNHEKLKVERKTEAEIIVYSRKAKIINEKSKVPKNAIQISCFKGLNHLFVDMQNRQPPIKPNGNNVWIWLWKDNEALMYTYNITNYNTYLNSSSFYYDSMGEIQNKFLDNFSDGLPFFKIKSDDILFYAREGDFYIKTDVKGSGGGTDYGNAVVGGLLFGGAGAVVASRQEVKVDTTTTEVDKRDTRLYYNCNNEIVDAHFDSGAYDIFRNLFPNKDEKVIDRLSRLVPEKKDKNVHTIDRPEGVKISARIEDDVYTKLEKLSALKEKGIITVEEYNEKKMKLLDLI